MTATLTPEERLALVREAYGGRRANKYGARRCTEHDGRHASLKECRRFSELVLMERAGVIENLKEQVRISLCVECEKPLVYVADFMYDEWREGPFGPSLVAVLEDTKGIQTPVFKLKRHLLAHQGLEVRVI